MSNRTNRGGAVLFVTLFMAVMAEAWILGADNVDIETVTAFEMSEAGEAATLRNALEDARAVVKYMAGEHDRLAENWFDANNAGAEASAEYWRPQVEAAAAVQFQAMRLQGLIEHMEAKARASYDPELDQPAGSGGYAV